MASQQEFEDALSGVDAEVTRITAEIADLKAQLSAGGMTADQEAQVLADLNARLAALKAVGVEPPPA